MLIEIAILTACETVRANAVARKERQGMELVETVLEYPDPFHPIFGPQPAQRAALHFSDGTSLVFQPDGVKQAAFRSDQCRAADGATVITYYFVD